MKMDDEDLIVIMTKKAAQELGVSYAFIQDRLQFLKFYDNLMSLMGNDPELAKNWVYTGNKHLRYTPILKVHHAYYLKQINSYLESFFR
jgi:hypothetical protein